MGNHSTRRLGLSIVACLLWLCLGAGPAATASTAGNKAYSPPDIHLEVIPERDAVEAGRDLQVFVRAVNLSDVEATVVGLQSISPGLTVPQIQLPTQLPAFGSLTLSLPAHASSDPELGFGPRRIVLLLRYRWNGEGRTYESSQVAAVPVQVRRKYEEETGGVLGGSSASFYLLLPILPAYLVYQISEQLRKREGFRLPTLSTEDLLAAFLLAITANLFFLLLPLCSSRSFDYSDPKSLATVLAVSAALGAAVPALRSLVTWRQMRRWGFHEDEELGSYLEKALLGPKNRARQLHWAKTSVGGSNWEGLLLLQPDGSQALGPQLQIGVGADVPDEQQASARAEMERLIQRARAGDPAARRLLVEKVELRELEIDPNRLIRCDGRNVEAPRLFVEHWGVKMAEVQQGAPDSLIIVPGSTSNQISKGT